MALQCGQLGDDDHGDDDPGDDDHGDDDHGDDRDGKSGRRGSHVCAIFLSWC